MRKHKEREGRGKEKWGNIKSETGREEEREMRKHKERDGKRRGKRNAET